MPLNTSKLDEVKSTLFALCICQRDGCTIKQLADEYYESEGQHVPYKEYGYDSLLHLLDDMKNMVRIEFSNGKRIVKGIPTSSSSHISALVAGQKPSGKRPNLKKKQFRSSHYYPNVPVPRMHIPAEILSSLISLVKQCPGGINVEDALSFVRKKMANPYVSMSDVTDQLKDLSHEISVNGNILYPRSDKVIHHSETLDNVKVYAAGDETSDHIFDLDDEDDFEFVCAGHTDNSDFKKSNAMTKRTTSSFIEETVSKRQDKMTDADADTFQEDKEDRENCDYNFNEKNSQFHWKMNSNELHKEETNYLNYEHVDMLINDNIKCRLDKLIQKYPGGISCAQLPDKYLEEYKVNLNYMELGFSSVREFASHLPNIFHCRALSDTGDYILYSAKSGIPRNKTDNKPTIPSLLDLHIMPESIWECENEVLPTIVSIDTCKALIPDSVLSIGECVAQISVENLANRDKPYLEVYICEVFTPTFFWIQLRKQKKKFDSFMTELHNFYVSEDQNYIIPSVVFEKGLNCACEYNGIWHRGIIKTVQPDLQITVFFYDYGTLKTYPSNKLRYLHRKFSHLPAQAIPCALVNVKPYTGTKWTRSATHAFATRVSNIPLVATIASINEQDNSMVVTLTDTSEEDDIHINDWLVEHKLALHGKMVCMKPRNFLYQYYLERKRELQKFHSKLDSKVTSNHKVALYSSSTDSITNNESSDDARVSVNKNSIDSQSFQLPKISSSTGIECNLQSPRIIQPDEAKMGKNDTFQDSKFSTSTKSSSMSMSKILSLCEKIMNLKHKNESSTSTSAKDDNAFNDLKITEMNGISHVHESTLEEDDLLEPITYVSTPKTEASVENKTQMQFEFRTFEQDEDTDLICFGTCGGKCGRSHAVTPADWEEIRASLEKSSMPQTIAQTHRKKRVYEKEKCAEFKEQVNPVVPYNLFLNTVHQNILSSSYNGIRHWSPTTNLTNLCKDELPVLKQVKNTRDNSNRLIGISAATLDKFQNDITSSEVSAASLDRQDVSECTEQIEKKPSNISEEISSEIVLSDDSEDQDTSLNKHLEDSKCEFGIVSQADNSFSSCRKETSESVSTVSSIKKLDDEIGEVGEDDTIAGNEILKDTNCQDGMNSKSMDENLVLPTVDSGINEQTSVCISNGLEDRTEDIEKLISDSEAVTLESECNHSITSGENCMESPAISKPKLLNYFTYQEVRAAKSRILQVLAKVQNSSSNASELDSDDCSESEQDKGSVVEDSPLPNASEISDELDNESSREIMEGSVEEGFVSLSCTDSQEISVTSQEVSDEISIAESTAESVGLSDKNLQDSTDEILEESSAYNDGNVTNVINTVSPEITQNSVNEIVRIQSQVSENNNCTVPVLPSDIPICNDLDIESDSDEYDVHVRFSDFFKSDMLQPWVSALKG